MRFAMLMYPGDKAYDGVTPPDPEAFKAMMAYNEELVAAGVLLTGEGLHGQADGFRVKGSRKLVIDGPFAESKEVLGGFWLLNVASKDEALAWARKVPLADVEFVEVRRVHEQEEWPEEIQAATKGSHDRIQAQQAANPR